MQALLNNKKSNNNNNNTRYLLSHLEFVVQHLICRNIVAQVANGNAKLQQTTKIQQPTTKTWNSTTQQHTNDYYSMLTSSLKSSLSIGASAVQLFCKLSFRIVL
jgi:hypothetical protein